MGLVPKFTAADVQKMLKKRMEALHQLIVNELIYVGEAFVKNARDNDWTGKTYKNWTGNLRSSIGYTILYNGNPISENFEQSKVGTDKVTGVNRAKGLINSIKAKYQKGYVLIVVAGMEYAAKVESYNKDVLTGSSLKAKKDLKRAIDSIKSRVNK